MRIAVARDITASKRSSALQAAVYAISEAAHAAQDLGTLMRDIHQIIDALLAAPGCAVALSDGAGAALRFVYQHDSGSGGPPEPALYTEVAQRGLPLLASAASLPGLPAPLRKALGTGVAQWLGVPLTTSGTTIGVLAVHSGPGTTPYAESDLELLQFISAQVATAIQRQLLHAQLQQLAQRDELTGLANRRLLSERLEQALTRAQRHQGLIGVVFLDLDEFKQINDQHGHEAGDAVLREVARRLLGCVRDSDTVARVGGDEFVILLDCMQDGADVTAVVEKIGRVLAPPILLGSGVQLTVRPSLGIARYPEHGSDYQKLLRHADHAMYADKQRAQANRPACMAQQAW